MKNFQEIAEKCLNGELSGTFICSLNGEAVKVPSNNLFRYEETYYRIDYSYPHTYDVYNKFGVTKLGHRVINFIPDMKENDKRTIQISLQQAREWYNSGNDTLKTLALSSFSKKEIDPYPRNWKEYLENHPGNLVHTVAPENLGSKLTVYGVLLVLCQEWIHIWSQEQGLEKDWDPEWGSHKNNYCIDYTVISSTLIELTVDLYNYKFHSLSFPTKELAKDFINTFKDLLEEAKGLY